MQTNTAAAAGSSVLFCRGADATPFECEAHDTFERRERLETLFAIFQEGENFQRSSIGKAIEIEEALGWVSKESLKGRVKERNRGMKTPQEAFPQPGWRV